MLSSRIEYDTAKPPTCMKVDIRLPGKGNSNSHGARPVHLIITTIKWIRTSRLSIKNSLSLLEGGTVVSLLPLLPAHKTRHTPDVSVAGTFRLCTGSGSYLRLIDSCITQLKAQGPSRTCNESKEEEECAGESVVEMCNTS